MPSATLLEDFLAGLLVVGLIALAPLGVRVARAEPGSAPSSLPPQWSLGGVADGSQPNMCRVGDAPPTATSSRRDALSAVLARARAEAATSGDSVRVLNGRGHGYRVARDPWHELERVRAEARRAQGH